MDTKQFSAQLIRELNSIAQMAAKYVQAPAGSYTTTQLLRCLDKLEAKWMRGRVIEDAIFEQQEVKIDSFRCSFVTKDAFRILKRFETLYNVPSGKRAKFNF